MLEVDELNSKYVGIVRKSKHLWTNIDVVYFVSTPIIF